MTPIQGPDTPPSTWVSATEQINAKAGRNLPAAIGVGVSMGGLVLTSLLVWKPLFVVFVIVLAGLATWELSQVFRARGILVPLPPVLAGALAIPVFSYIYGGVGLLGACEFTCLAVLVWRFFGPRQGAIRDASAGVFITLYVVFLASFTVVMLRAEDGPLRVVVLLVMTVSNDVGAYAAGVLFGKHAIAPSISPKKTWEGLIGATVVCVGLGIVSVVYLLDGRWWVGILVGLAGMLCSTLGDLAESLLKRDLGIKDMSSVLPGHGGILDRVDSVLTTAPVVFLLLTVLVP